VPAAASGIVTPQPGLNSLNERSLAADTLHTLI